MARVREGRRGGLLTAKGEGEVREYWYDGTDTGDYWVDGRPCAETRQTSTEGVSGQEGDAPPGRTLDGWRRRAGQVKNIYVTISNGA